MNSITTIKEKFTEKANLLKLRHESELADLEDYLRREVVYVKNRYWFYRERKIDRAFKNLRQKHLEESNALIEEINRLTF